MEEQVEAAVRVGIAWRAKLAGQRDKMLDDRRAFGVDRAVFVKQGRLAEGVDAFQFGRRAHRPWVTLIAFDLIGQPHFLEAPQ